MNDINQASTIFRLILYADDTSLNSIISLFTQGNVNQLSAKINAEINLIFEWLSANKLSLNVGKTKYMIFRYPQTKLPILNLSVNGVTIEKVDNFDFLGLTINEKMSWNTHINKLSLKISKVIGAMSRVKNILNSSVLLNIYNSLILSRLHYGILCWGLTQKISSNVKRKLYV